MLDPRVYHILSMLLLIACGLITNSKLHADETGAGNSGKGASSDLSSQIVELKNELLKNPENAESRYVLGVLNLQLGAAVAAEKEFRRAQQYGWSRQLVLPLLGEAMLPQRKYQQILDSITIDSAYPSSINAQILGIRGQAELGLNRLFSAEKSIHAGIAADPDALAVLLGRLGVYQEKNDAEAFEAAMAQALTLYPGEPQLLLWRGLRALTHKQLGDAESYFKRVIDLAPSDLSTRWERQARLWLVQVYIRVSEFAKAEGQIGHLLKLDPDSSLANYLGALVAFDKDDYDLARNRLVKVLDQHPGMSSGRLMLGVTSYAQGSYEQAAYELSSYLASNPEDSWSQELLVKSYLQLKDFKRAGVVVEGWASRDQENSRLAELVALNALYSDKPKLAIRKLQTVVRKEISHRVLLVSAHLVAGETGQALEAVATLSEDVSFKDKYSVVLDLLQRRAWPAALDVLQQLPKNLVGAVWTISLAGSLQAIEGHKEEATALFKKAFSLHAIGGGAVVISSPANLLPNQSQSEVLAEYPAELHGIYRRVGSWEEITNGIGANSPYTYSLWAETPFSQWMRDDGVFAVSLEGSEGTGEAHDADGLGHLIEQPIVLLDSKLPPFSVLAALIVIIGLRIVSGMRK